MSKAKKTTFRVQDTEITVLSGAHGDFISLTDMLRAKDGDFFISDWLRNRNTVEYLGIWESVHNPDFNYGEFAIIRNQAIRQGLEASTRLSTLNEIAITQMRSLLASDGTKRLTDSRNKND